MAKLHAATLEFYKLRGYRSLLTRCIENDVPVDRFRLDFDVSNTTNVFINDTGAFLSDQNGAMDFSGTLSNMNEGKKEYTTRIGQKAKEIYDLKQLLKSSCNGATFKNATFFLSGIYGTFASTIDKHMDRLYENAVTTKKMNESCRKCWNDNLNSILSSGSFNILGNDFKDFIDKDFIDKDFIDTEASINDENVPEERGKPNNDDHLLRTESPETLKTVKLDLKTNIPARNPFKDISNREDATLLRNGYVKKDGIVYNAGSSLSTNHGNAIPVLKRKHED